MSSKAAYNGPFRVSGRWWAQGVRALHSTALRLTSTGLSLVFGIVGARLIGAEGFGAYASLMAIVGFLSVATSVGLPTLVIREIASARGSGAHDGVTPLTQICCLIVALSLLTVCTSLMFRSFDLSLVMAIALAFNVVMILFEPTAGMSACCLRLG